MELSLVPEVTLVDISKFRLKAIQFCIPTQH